MSVKSKNPPLKTTSKWTQQDAANKSYPRLKKRHKKQKTAVSSEVGFNNGLVGQPPFKPYTAVHGKTP